MAVKLTIGCRLHEEAITQPETLRLLAGLAIEISIQRRAMSLFYGADD
jgi:hypothetical protein